MCDPRWRIFQDFPKFPNGHFAFFSGFFNSNMSFFHCPKQYLYHSYAKPLLKAFFKHTSIKVRHNIFPFLLNDLILSLLFTFFRVRLICGLLLFFSEFFHSFAIVFC